MLEKEHCLLNSNHLMFAGVFFFHSFIGTFTWVNDVH